MEIIHKYFTELSEEQERQFKQLASLYEVWNSRINLISRKDIENLYERHVLHSLVLSAVMPELKSGTEILDLGTGGGFPGIPLAILLPEVQFYLIDGTGKKIMVVNEIAAELGLKNVQAHHVRAEEWKGAKVDFVVSRAVAPLDQLLNWSRPLLKKKEQNAYPNGLFAWKGGSIKEELKSIGKGEYRELIPISDFFEEDYFLEKFLVYVQG